MGELVVRGLRFVRATDDTWFTDGLGPPRLWLAPGCDVVVNENTLAAVRFSNVDGRIVDDYVGTWTPDGVENVEEPVNDRSLFAELWNSPVWIVDDIRGFDVDLRPGALDDLGESALQRFCRGLDIPIELVNSRPWTGG